MQDYLRRQVFGGGVTQRYLESPTCQIENLLDLYAEHIGYKIDGVFVEIGAHDGLNWSNTWGLGMAGWRGLAVEANPQYADACRATYATRPNVETVCVAVGREAGTANLYLSGSTSTIVPEIVDFYNSYGPLQGGSLDRYIPVQVVTLDSLLSERNWPARYDVLVVDVEGAELDVLEGYTLPRWRPTLAIVETHALLDYAPLAERAAPINAYFARHGYALVQADTVNSVYVDRGLA